MSDEALLARLQQLEEYLLQRATRQDADLVAALLTADFREFGTSGQAYTRDTVLAALQDEPPALITADDFTLHVFSPDAALLTYISTKITTGSDPVRALRSSLWVRRAGNWQMLFHQGTRIA